MDPPALIAPMVAVEPPSIGGQVVAWIRSP